MRSVVDADPDALELLHREGVYHRDIAPDNILLLHDGPPVLLDFGAARRVISDRTQSLTAILKPSYAPIEQYAEMTQLRQGPWTDLYALGAVVHYLLFGAPPAPATARAVQDDADAIENRIVPGVSPRFLEADVVDARGPAEPAAAERRAAARGARRPRRDPAARPARHHDARARSAPAAPGAQIEQVGRRDPHQHRATCRPTCRPRGSRRSDQRATDAPFSPTAPMPTARQAPIADAPSRPVERTAHGGCVSPPRRRAAAGATALRRSRSRSDAAAGAGAGAPAPVARRRPFRRDAAGAGAPVPPSPPRSRQRRGAPRRCRIATPAAGPRAAQRPRAHRTGRRRQPASLQRRDGPPSQPASLQHRDGPPSQPASWAASRPAARCRRRLRSAQPASGHPAAGIAAGASRLRKPRRRRAARRRRSLARPRRRRPVRRRRGARAPGSSAGRRDGRRRRAGRPARRRRRRAVVARAGDAGCADHHRDGRSFADVDPRQRTRSKSPAPTPSACDPAGRPRRARRPADRAPSPDAGAASAARLRPPGKPVPPVGEEPALAATNGIGTTRPPESPTTGSPNPSVNGDRHAVPRTPPPRDYGSVQRPTAAPSTGGPTIRDVCKGSFFERNVCMDQRCEEAALPLRRRSASTSSIASASARASER